MTSIWIEAARPRTLPAAVGPVLVGTAIADPVRPARAVAALVVAVSLQIAVNYANDYFDGVKGVDRPDRVGPRRAVASGAVAPRAMRTAVGVALCVSIAAGSYLILEVGFELLWVGVPAIAAALAYSGGPRPYASAGLGEVFVFLFFGIVATAGTYYVQTENLGSVPFVCAVPIGALAVAILLLNNLRDIPTDRAVRKLTLATRIGEGGTVRLYIACLVVAVASAPLIAAIADAPWALLALGSAVLALPVAIEVHRHRADPRALIGALGDTARLHLAYSLVLALGLTMSRA
ncbi:MAG TPA: 1,4-dihydroxy-2-naphthoate polyprenyltransferase [Actinomycetota bacterium]|nr:1,4-dihydroxy-2-naphthoate polyprenyltransferase [Actinomycetota bacterium]